MLVTKAPRCSNLGCSQPKDQYGSLCNRCGHRYRFTGALGLQNLTRAQRKPYIQAAAAILRKRTKSPNAQALNEMQALLDSCKPYLRRQADVLRLGWGSKEKAKCLLANIARQRGTRASRVVLAAAAGAACCPKPTSNERYRKVQIARSVYSLCRSDKSTLFGRTISSRIPMAGIRLALALFDLVEPIFYYWLKDGGRVAVARKVAPTLTFPRQDLY